MVTEQEQEQEARYLSTTFKVDMKWLAAQGRSVQLLLLNRRCASCWGGFVQEPAKGRDVGAAVHLKQIAQHCSAAPDFIHFELPIMEAVFRILLSTGNKPTTLESIYQTLQERWLDPANPRTPRLEKLYRILSNDTSYGISQVPEPATKGK